MTDETRDLEMRDDATEYQDLVDEPTMPAVSTPLTATEPQSEDDWRLPPSGTEELEITKNLNILGLNAMITHFKFKCPDYTF